MNMMGVTEMYKVCLKHHHELLPKLQNSIAQRRCNVQFLSFLTSEHRLGKVGTVGTGLNTAGVLNLLCAKRKRWY